jgi:hypothetical protein
MLKLKFILQRAPLGSECLAKPEKPFRLCLLPTLTGVGNHHSLFGLFGFRGKAIPWS